MSINSKICLNLSRKLLVHLLRLRQRNHHFLNHSETKQNVHVDMGMGCCFYSEWSAWWRRLSE